jgi:hypothetical protein
MKRNLVLALLLLATLGCGAYFFNTSNADHKMSSNIPDRISIQVGETAASFVHRYPFVKIQKQPAGMNFYKIHADSIDKNKSAIVKIVTWSSIFRHQDRFFCCHFLFINNRRYVVV